MTLHHKSPPRLLFPAEWCLSSVERKNNQAFTIVELLAVVAITGMLATVSLLGISKMLDASRGAQAISNLRQCYISIQRFANDNNGRIVPHSSVAFGAKYGWGKAMDWSEILVAEDCVDPQAAVERNIFGNPVMRKYYSAKGAKLASGATWARNAGIGEDGDGSIVRFQSLAQPSKTMLLTEGSIQPNMSWFWLSRYACHPWNGSPSNRNLPPPDFQHDKSNILFCDGHTELLANPDIPESFWGATPPSGINPHLFWQGVE